MLWGNKKVLRHIWAELTLFAAGADRVQDEKDICAWLEALTFRNQGYLKARPSTPRLYKSGVVWEAPQQLQGDIEEVKILRQALGSAARRGDVRRVLEKIQDVLGGEHFCDIGVILERGAIDCFPLSQKIIARSKSTRQYELLSIGELRFAYQAYEALSYNFETGRQEFRSIVGFVDKGVKPVSKAHLSNGTDLIATDSHVFWALNGSRQYPPQKDSLKVGTRTMGEFVDVYEKFQAGTFSDGQRTNRSRILQAARIPVLDVTCPSSAEAYLAGIYAAEGFRSASITGIAQHKGEVRESIEQALGEVGVAFSYDKGRGKTPGSGAQYRLLGGAASPTVAFLRELGADSFDKRFPQSYLSGDRETVRRMLDAHADGDGWRPRGDVKYKKTNTDSIAVEHSTSSDALMEQIRFGNLILGNPVYTYKQLNHQGAGNSPIWRIDEFNDQASKLRSREARLRDLGLADLTYATVRNAVPFGKARVGCIEVEGNHNFFLADGTLAANCDGLAAFRTAELRQAGIPARPFMTSRERPGGTTYHALVIWPPLGPCNYETSEDPSLLLGMYQPEKKAERDLEIQKNRERCDILRKYGRRALRPSAISPTSSFDGASLDAAVSDLLGRRVA